MLGWLFGGSKTADKVIDTATDSVRGIGNWIDEQQLTDEERIKFKAEAFEQHMRFMEITRQENGIRSVTRRVMSWAIVGTVLLLAMIATGFSVAGNAGVVDSIVTVASKFWLGESFLAIIAFYFGLQAIRANKGSGQ